MLKEAIDPGCTSCRRDAGGCTAERRSTSDVCWKELLTAKSHLVIKCIVKWKLHLFNYFIASPTVCSVRAFITICKHCKCI